MPVKLNFDSARAYVPNEVKDAREALEKVRGKVPCPGGRCLRVDRRRWSDRDAEHHL